MCIYFLVHSICIKCINKYSYIYSSYINVFWVYLKLAINLYPIFNCILSLPCICITYVFSLRIQFIQYCISPLYRHTKNPSMKPKRRNGRKEVSTISPLIQVSRMICINNTTEGSWREERRVRGMEKMEERGEQELDIGEICYKVLNITMQCNFLKLLCIVN